MQSEPDQGGAMKKLFFLFLGVLATCSASSEDIVNKDLEHGRADIVSTIGNKSVHGTVDFTETPEGLKVVAHVHGLSPGKHGFHVHEYGDISDHGKAAGGHYNPDHTKHGFIVRDGYANAHAGDFGNIDVDKEGNGTLELFIPKMSLSGGKYNIAGRSIIIHKNEDMFTQPDGNAGPRIAGGTIMIVGK